ncbi:MAG: Maf family protein [Caulobacteraceae bacterium]
MRVILASNSPRRRELLTQIGVDYEVIPSGFEEKSINRSPSELVKHFAYMKAAAVAASIKEEALVIGADTIVYLDEVMGKPRNEEDAFQMLLKLSGKEHYVLSGVSVIHTLTKQYITEYESTRVKIRHLSEEEIRSYISTGEPMDKAGAYAIQGLGSLFVEGIAGDYFNVVGLPLFRLGEMLKSFKIDLMKNNMLVGE